MLHCSRSIFKTLEHHGIEGMASGDGHQSRMAFAEAYSMDKPAFLWVSLYASPSGLKARLYLVLCYINDVATTPAWTGS